MKYTTVSELYASPEAYYDKSVTVCGWVRTIRDSKNFAFVELNDGSHLKSLQIVLRDQGGGHALNISESFFQYGRVQRTVFVTCAEEPFLPAS